MTIPVTYLTCIMDDTLAATVESGLKSQ